MKHCLIIVLMTRAQVMPRYVLELTGKLVCVAWVGWCAGVAKVDGGGGKSSGMPCTTCRHPTCQHSPARQGVAPCPSCASGTLVLDPLSGPKWRLDCSLCSVLIYLPPNLHAAKVSKADVCGDCGCKHLELDWKKVGKHASP